jgi:Protein of unknown function (DUF2442)
MSTLTIKHPCNAQEITFTENAFRVLLDDGRSISVPLTWYPRLLHVTEKELQNYELIGDGEGIHWPDLDEDISIEGIIAGRRSGESQKSFRKWLESKVGRQG